MKNSSCQDSFVLKVAPNNGKRYSEETKSDTVDGRNAAPPGMYKPL